MGLPRRPRSIAAGLTWPYAVGQGSTFRPSELHFLDHITLKLPGVPPSKACRRRRIWPIRPSYRPSHFARLHGEAFPPGVLGTPIRLLRGPQLIHLAEALTAELGLPPQRCWVQPGCTGRWEAAREDLVVRPGVCTLQDMLRCRPGTLRLKVARPVWAVIEHNLNRSHETGPLRYSTSVSGSLATTVPKTGWRSAARREVAGRSSAIFRHRLRQFPRLRRTRH